MNDVLDRCNRGYGDCQNCPPGTECDLDLERRQALDREIADFLSGNARAKRIASLQKRLDTI